MSDSSLRSFTLDALGSSSRIQSLQLFQFLTQAAVMVKMEDAFAQINCPKLAEINNKG